MEVPRDDHTENPSGGQVKAPRGCLRETPGKAPFGGLCRVRRSTSATAYGNRLVAEDISPPYSCPQERPPSGAVVLSVNAPEGAARSAPSSPGDCPKVDLGCVVHGSSLGHSSVNTDRPLPIARRSSAVHRFSSEHPAGVPENSSLASESVIPRSARARS